MGVIVQKYGGTSVANLERIQNVARRVVRSYEQGHDVVVIVSAMSGVTDGLIGLAGDLHPLQPQAAHVLDTLADWLARRLAPGGGH